MSQSEKHPLETVATVGSKMARSCDSCVQQNARWYCAVDDAFLCQHCDASVHSANPLVLRHHRLQLRTPTKLSYSPEGPLPAWHSGFTRKARTPRMHNKAVSPLVPEIETSKENNNDNEEELLYRVPIFDPVLAEFSSPAPFLDDNSNVEVKPPMTITDISDSSKKTNDCLVGLLPSDIDLAEFAADIESLLGGGLDNESFSMEELGLGDTNCGLVDSHLVKEELDGEDASGDIELYEEMDLSREVTREIKFDNWGSPTTEEEDDREEMRPDTKCRSRKAVGLRLDCEAIIAEWSSVQGSCSPWMNGKRPQFGPDDCWLDYMEKWGGGSQVQGVVQGEVGGGHIDERREARVSRYREKRRTRLFSKKIRYEVRKLNAEKRPRMKGRFVKRASFATPTPTEGITFP